MLAGTAYAFLPYHMVHFLSGHLNISAIQWFPLYFWGFAAILTEKEKSSRNIWPAGNRPVRVALTSQYYLFTTFVVSALILLVYFLFIQRRQFLDWVIWKQFLLAGLLSIPALVVGVVPYMLVHNGGEARSLQDVMQFSAGLSDYLLPFTRHFLWGKWVWANFPRDLWNEATLYIGLPLTALAVLGFTKRREDNHKALFHIFLAGFLVSLILSMGTNLTWMEQPVTVAPDSWLGKLFNDPDGLVYLSGYFFFKTIPFYDIMRAWMRFGVFALLFNCAAAGIGLAWLLRRWPKWQSLLAGAAIGLVLLDFYVTPNFLSRVQPREVDLWLAQQPYGGQVQLPLKQSYEEYSLYYTLTSQKPIIGVIRTFPSNRYFELNPLLVNFPDETSLAALWEQQLTYVVLDEEYYPITEDFVGACEALGMKFQVSLDGQAVFTLP